MSEKVTSSPAKKVVGKKNPQATLKRPAPSLTAVSQSALADSADLTPEKILALQRTAGNQAVQRLLAQRQAQTATTAPKPAEARPNRTGMPDGLKTGVETLSGISLDDVRVHTNSPKPAQLNALAYTQGTDIHVAPGQEEHLPHEAWHVVQQKQGRVQPTMQMKEGVPVNDDKGLEHEADVMGGRAKRGETVGCGVGVGETHREGTADGEQYIDKGGLRFPNSGSDRVIQGVFLPTWSDKLYIGLTVTTSSKPGLTGTINSKVNDQNYKITWSDTTTTTERSDALEYAPGENKRLTDEEKKGLIAVHAKLVPRNIEAKPEGNWQSGPSILVTYGSVHMHVSDSQGHEVNKVHSADAQNRTNYYWGKDRGWDAVPIQGPMHKLISAICAVMGYGIKGSAYADVIQAKDGGRLGVPPS